MTWGLASPATNPALMDTASPALFLRSQGGGISGLVPITEPTPNCDGLVRAEFRQALHEAGLMMRRESLLRQIASLRRDRKATYSARAELRAVTHETLAMGDRR
jgi:hypothetical protein